MGANGKAKDVDLLHAVMGLTAEVSEMRQEMDRLPERTAGRAVELLFEQLRGLNQKDFLALKLAAAFDPAHIEAP